MSPDRTGAGRRTGSQTDMDWPAAVRIVASGPAPPLDSCSSLVVKLAEIVPAGPRSRRAVSGCHAPPTRLRTGTRDRVSVSVPLGLAVSVSVGVVAPGTATGRWLAAARASACSVVSGPRGRDARDAWWPAVALAVAPAEDAVATAIATSTASVANTRAPRAAIKVPGMIHHFRAGKAATRAGGNGARR